MQSTDSTSATTATTDAETGQQTESTESTEATTTTTESVGQSTDSTGATTATTDAETGQQTESAESTEATTTTTASVGQSTDSTGATTATTDAETGPQTESTESTESTTTTTESAALTPAVSSVSGDAESEAVPESPQPPDDGRVIITTLPPAPSGVQKTTIIGPDGKPVEVFVVDGEKGTLEELKKNWARRIAQAQGDYNTSWWLNKPAGVATQVVSFGGEIYVGVHAGPLVATWGVFVRGTAQEAASREWIRGYAEERDKQGAYGAIGTGLQDAAISATFDGAFLVGGKLLGKGGQLLKGPLKEATEVAENATREVAEQTSRGLRHAQETYERSVQAATEAAQRKQRDLAAKLARAREIGENVDNMGLQDRLKAGAELGMQHEGGRMGLRQAARREARAIEKAMSDNLAGMTRQVDEAASRLLDRRNTIIRAAGEVNETIRSTWRATVARAVAEETAVETAEESSKFVYGKVYGDNANTTSAPRSPVN